VSSAAAIVGGLYIGTESSGAGADPSSKVSTWSGSLVLELLAVVPFLAAIPALFHELAHSALLHAREPAAVDVALGASELLPMVAILPFMLYQLAGFAALRRAEGGELDHQHRHSLLDHRPLRRLSRGQVHAGKAVQRSPGYRHGDYGVLRSPQAEADAGDL
jgi:hypothetical protein